MNDSFKFPCTFFVKDGAPDVKTCTFEILKLFPGGNEAVIATKSVNLGMHFGEFSEQDYEMEVTK